MSGQTILALSLLVSLVDADLALCVPGIETKFGWREKARQQRVPCRVVWVPGDESGSLGKELGATKVPITVGPNQTARNLADIDELFHVQIQAHDPSDPDNEKAQYTFTRLLFDAWRGSVYRATHGTRNVGQLHIDSVRWVINNTTEFRRGATLVATARLRCPVPDTIATTALATISTVDVTPATADLNAPELDIPIPAST